MKIFQKAIQGIGIVLLALFTFIMLLNFLSAPDSKGLFGYKGYIILSGSMESVLTPGDFIIVKDHPYQTIRENDVVTFEMENRVITHRVIKLSTAGLTTKGDANTVEDNSQVTKRDYIGTLKLALPYIGRIILLLQKPYMIAIYIVLIGSYFIFSSFDKKKK
ncbi:signal peptidase I [Carnobacterium funditum]|uniref:signal peptidase I n=1 Tax=Carnobacterium funditum TaxID=2752 RepID=UPI00055028B0|nr:signal peptidase I [Carnobacterium funditum]